MSRRFLSPLLLAAAMILSACQESPKGAVEAGACGLDRPIMFAGFDWNSAAFHNALAREILETGYGCATDSLPGSSIPLLTGLNRGDVDVAMEVWMDRATEVWDEGVAQGLVTSLGVNFPDAVQGWYVPRYLVEGEDALAPDLRSVFDLERYWALFRDPESPSKGRFYNCILGWLCEGNNTKKLAAYGLEDRFTNFRPGTGAALAAAIASHFTKGEPFVAYYWEPTWVTGKYDLVMLDEPPYSDDAWDAFVAAEAPEAGLAFPKVEVHVGVNTAFLAEVAPDVTEFLRAYETDRMLIAEALAWLNDNPQAAPRDAAIRFLKTRRDLWSAWVTPDVQAKLDTALAE